MLSRLLCFLLQLVSVDFRLKNPEFFKNIDKTSIGDYSSRLRKLIVLDGDQRNFPGITKLLKNLPQLQTFWYTAFFCDR